MNYQLSRNRKANFELLRLVAMYFIILHHLILFGHKYWSELVNITSINLLHINICTIIEPFLIIGVNLFFLISGYFGIRFSISKFVSLLLTFYLYIILIQVFGIITGQNHFDFEFIKTTVLYIREYWYVKVYLILFLISPFLNRIIFNSSRRDALWFLFIYIMVFCVLSLISDGFIGANGGYSVISAMGVYIIGGYIHRGLLFKKRETSYCFIWYVLFSIINIVICIYCINVLKDGIMVKEVLSYNNPIIVFQSIFFFMTFERIRMDSNNRLSGLVIYMSQSVLAVYVLHSTNKVLSFWRNRIVDYVCSVSWPLALLFCVIYSVFILLMCVFIDKALMLLFAKVIKNISCSFERIIRKCYNCILKRFCE